MPVRRILLLSPLLPLILLCIDFATWAAPQAPGPEPAIKMPARGLCAHRGENLTCPENTMAAFGEAIRLGAAMVECDVWLTRDGEPVIIHDASVDRTTQGTGKVHDLTLAQIRALDAGAWKSPKFVGERVPTLIEFLRAMPRNVWLNIQVMGEEPLGRLVARLVVQEGRLHQSILAGSPRMLTAARQVHPSILTLNLQGQVATESYIERSIALKSDFIQLYGAITTQHVARLHAASIRVNHFWADDNQRLEELVRQGVDFPLVDHLPLMRDAAGALGLPLLEPIYP